MVEPRFVRSHLPPRLAPGFVRNGTEPCLDRSPSPDWYGGLSINMVRNLVWIGALVDLMIDMLNHHRLDRCLLHD